MSELNTQAYDVHVHTPETTAGEAETLVVDECKNEEEAREKALRQDRVNDVHAVEPHIERVELAIQGTTDEIAEYLEAVDFASSNCDVYVEGRDPENAALEMDEEDGVPTFSVEDWTDVSMRVIGVGDHIENADGLTMKAEQVATDDSVVEMLIGEKNIARIVLTDQPWPQEVSPDA